MTRRHLLRRQRARQQREGSDEDDDEGSGSARQRKQEQRSEQRDDRHRNDRQADQQEEQQRTRHVDDTELDWNTELEWSPAPRPTPAPVAFAGAAPFMPGARVRVDLSGLPLLGVFLGKGASAAGTIVGVNARERAVCIHLDACFDGEKQIVLPPERIVLDR